MALDKQQVQMLQSYLKYRSAPPSLNDLFRQNLKVYLPMLLMVIIIGWLGTVGGPQWLTLLVGGMFLGTILRDAGIFRRFVKLWPTLQTIIDWPAAERLLAKNKTQN